MSVCPFFDKCVVNMTFWKRDRERFSLYTVRHSAVSCTKTAEPIDLPLELWTPLGRRMYKFSRIRQGRQSARRHSFVTELCKNDSTDGFAVWVVDFGGTRKHKFNSIRQVAQTYPYGRTHCHVPPPAEYDCVCGGDVSYATLLWALQVLIFDHDHLDSRTVRRTDSRALRAENCIVNIPHNTAI